MNCVEFELKHAIQLVFVLEPQFVLRGMQQSAESSQSISVVLLQHTLCSRFGQIHLVHQQLHIFITDFDASQLSVTTNASSPPNLENT